MTAAKVMDIISRLPGCAGQAADAVFAYTQVKMEDAQKLLKIPQSECPEICPAWQIQSFLLNETWMVILWQDFCGKGNLRKFFWSTVGTKFSIGNAYSCTDRKDYSYLCTLMTSNWLDRRHQSDVASTQPRKAGQEQNMASTYESR